MNLKRVIGVEAAGYSRLLSHILVTVLLVAAALIAAWLCLFASAAMGVNR